MTSGSLRQRLFLLVVMLTIPLFALHEIIEIRRAIRTVTQHVAADVQDIGAATVPLLKSTLVVGDLATAQETLDNIASHGQFRSLWLLAPDGHHILVESKPAPESSASRTPAWFVDWLDLRFAVRQFPIEVGGTRYGVLAAEPATLFMAAGIWERLWIAVVFWLAAVILFLVLLRFSLRHDLKPLEDLADAARRLGEGHLDCRAPVEGAPELAQTAIAFNRMADKLTEARNRLEERVRQATRDLENLISRIPVGVFKLRRKQEDGSRFDYVSQRCCQLLEITEEEVYHNPEAPYSRIHPDEVDALRSRWKIAQDQLIPFLWEGRLREGLQARWLHVEATPTRLDNGDILWEGIQYDITAVKEREAELDLIAHYDPLTGAPNRLLLADRLHQAISQAKRTGTPLAVCYMDLDGFKPVNDSFGHEAGDWLLVEITRRLEATVRGGDTVARIGGDEFVLLLAGLAHMDEYETALNRILEVVGQPISIGNERVTVSASIGIALYPKDDSDPDLLLRHADQAMYQAKQTGRNKFIFFDPLQEDAARRHRTWLHQIEAGLEAGEFELYYQPKVNMRLGRVVGFEGLVRWHHPEKGLLGPDKFLPLVADNDLAIALGERMLDQALAQLGQWLGQGLDVSVSVNMAPHHLQQENFSAWLRQCLARHGNVPPQRLEIEIIETAALANTAQAANLVRECQPLGVSFALDDFGTGYASLTYLKNLPVQTLKIDQSFVGNMLMDANDLDIVEGVIELGEIFNRQVVAEGVESPEHALLLLNMGCEVAQGLGIAAPMPAREVTSWLAAWQPDMAWQTLDGLRWPRDDRPLVIAHHHHREWVEKVAAHLDGQTDTLPELDARRCRFGQWYADGGRRRYGRYPEFARLDQVHGRVHSLGHELARLVNDGQLGEARAHLPELYALRDELLEQLRQLMKVAVNTP